MDRTTITGVDDFTAAGITRLWNEPIYSMLEGLRTDLYYAKSEGKVSAGELRQMEYAEQALTRLDSGVQTGGPRELRDAVQAWLAYYFRSAEMPVGMPLGPVYRLAAELSDLSLVLERAELDAAPNDPWATGAPTPA